MDRTATSLAVLAGLVILVAAIAAFGARFEPGAWYEELRKPSWTPPGWLFGPVWGVLYLMIAVAGWLVWRERGFSGASAAFAVYGLQLGLNAAWSWIFFGLHAPRLALLEIALLAAVIAWNAALFYAVRPLAGALLLPYLAWVLFAATLNAAIVHLNRFS